MDRRSGLAVLLGRSTTAKKTTTAAPPVLTTLAPYTGDWDFAQAAHLLRRTMYGPTFLQIKQSVTDGLDATVSQLLAPQNNPSEPIYYNFDNDPNVPNGEVWVNTPPTANIQGLNGGRRSSLNAWSFGLMKEGGVSIREKMTLFWHNHFVASNTNRNQFRYFYMKTLRDHALGNFQKMTEQITIDPAMLLFLNGAQNSRQAPNENYSRELLELFTIGKGDAAGPGDYTTFTEDDVVQLAKALTGWQIRTDRNTGNFQVQFNPNRHDTGDKQLSHRFDNVVIPDAGDKEYINVIDLILQKEETARYICRRLHIWLVGSNIDADVEANVIEPMAAILRQGYEIKPAIEALLKSEYFYQESLKGCMVNHPIDFIFKMVNTFELAMPNTEIEKYFGWNGLYNLAVELEMAIFSHATVAGWKAFYQGPAFYDVWANSVSLPKREGMVDTLINGYRTRNQRFLYKLDLLSAVKKLDNPFDPNELINDLAKTLYPFPISQEQLDFLKDVLIPGLPDFEWTVEYSDYVADPTNQDKRDGVINKLEALLKTMLKMPEFYLI